MPSSKTISILIVSLAAVFSVWIFADKQEVEKNKLAIKNKENVVVTPAINIDGPENDDWKKILTTLDAKKEKVVDLTKTGANESDTTLTDQMSRDFMSQYFLAVKAGQTITPEIAKTIAQNTLSLPEYNAKSVVYIRQNLKITQKNDSATMQKYKQQINQSLQSIYYELKDNPFVVLINALKTENLEDLKKIDPIIAINKAQIKYLLGMEVPESAVDIHLKLLNVSSSILLDLESMRAGLEDPVKIFPAIAKYTEDSAQFKTVIESMNEFLLKNS